MIPGWTETIWSIEVMASGLVSEAFLVNLLECLPLVLHRLLWEFPNLQATQGGSFLISLSFHGIIPLLDSLMRYLKEKLFSLWFQTRISLSSRTRISSVEHSLDMSSP